MRVAEPKVSRGVVGGNVSLEPPRMDEFRFIKFRIDGEVARLTLDRPEHNMLNERMLVELAAGIDSLILKLKLAFRMTIIVVTHELPSAFMIADRMTVMDNLMMGAFRRRDRAAVASDLERMFSLFPRLGELRTQLAGSMSGGEQQMCAVARGLMARPELLMIDEMSLGLAPVVVEQLMDVLQAIRKQDVTVLLVEQDIHLALSVADRGYVMDTGSIVRSGRGKDLIDDPAVREAYLGLTEHPC